MKPILILFMILSTTIVTADEVVNIPTPLDSMTPEQNALSTKAAIPIKLEDGHILVWAKINNRGPFEFVIDSGGGGSHVISEAVAIESKIKLGEARSGFSAGGEIALRDGGEQEVSFTNGATHLAKIHIEKYAFGEPPVDGIQPLAGTLGTPLFNNYVVEFDFANSVMYLHDLKSWTAPEDTSIEKLRFGFFNPVPKVKLSINNVKTKLILDTGAFAPAILTRKAAKRFGLGTGVTSDSLGTGAARLDTSEVIANQVNFGNRVFEDVSILTVNPVGNGFNGAGVLGMGILACQRIWISFRHKKLYLGEKDDNQTCMAPVTAPETIDP